VLSSALETGAAVNGPFTGGLEGNLGSCPASRTGDGIHLLVRTVAVPLLFFAGTADLAPGGFVFEALAGIKLLLPGGKIKLSPTFLASQGLVLVHNLADLLWFLNYRTAPQVTPEPKVKAKLVP
jgi:hypothetical protein